LLSLPRLLRLGLDDLPGVPVPYLQADPERVARWRARLADLPPARLRVGVVWQGNPRFRGDRLRSFHVTHLGPLANLGGVQLISLQCGPGADQMGDWGRRMGVIDLGP